MDDDLHLNDEYQVLHLRDGIWHHVALDSWSKFLDKGELWAPLPHVISGQHYFVVCVVHDGRLFNIHPHRYLIDNYGRIIDDNYFGVLSNEEIKEYEGLNRRHFKYPQTNPLNEMEQQAFDTFRDRLWRSCLPPAEAVRQLTDIVTALPDETDAAWNVLEACGFKR